MTSLNDFIDPDLTTSDVLHSNGYAQAAADGVMGAGAGGLSMEQRRQLRMKENRQVGDYLLSSRLGRQGSAVKARTADQKSARVYDASSGTFSDKAGYSKHKGGYSDNRAQIQVPPVERRQHFVEPPTRMHDPFA